jgi:hypothetical protein
LFYVSQRCYAFDVNLIDESKLPPTPGTGLCLCGAAYYFQRSGIIGRPGHFWCKRCGRRYRMYDEEPWIPGARPPSSLERALKE